MEDLINDSIIESISEEYQIYKMTVDYDLVNDSSIVRYVIRDENEELVRHNNMSFFPTKEDADKALAEIVYKRFEEAAQ
jgi:hypothetical protein|tara:strand:- start:55 stop:291 length:237 start_codon:yes stop_codon:yes gene_type:complete